MNDRKRIEREFRENPVLAGVLIDNPYEGFIVVNKDGFVTFISNLYLDTINLTREDTIGKHITEVHENTKLTQVLETGKPISYDYWETKGMTLIVVRFPILNNAGDLIGAVGKAVFVDIPSGKTLANKLKQLEKEVEFYRQELYKFYNAKYTFNDMIGESDAIKKVKKIAQKIALSESTVLITGESGTGKELFAQAIHNASYRSRFPFVRINCAAVPENLLEAELFGYAEGAFTGAKKGGKPGKFELAQGGTIFLDEIGELPLSMQSKLLNVLQEREIERVGGIRTVSVDFRVIAATNRNLEDMVKEGTFRDDLYYRLNVISLKIPSLRERQDDIPLLVNYFTDKLNNKLKCSVERFTEEAMLVLSKHYWPGNIRELQNTLERVFILSDDNIISVNHLPFSIKMRKGNIIQSKRLTLDEMIDQTEKRIILDTLSNVKDDRIAAAELLGIHLSSLYRKMKKHGIKKSFTS
ncbi:transcriptional regulator [Desulforamulus reducens MI-1]|uniref:Transcriptional regulator n=1 Tax=Desulforamulus reducens (strain ATCC BAA-1160 / DSM 100696 / MI-1) TaxID=349161 RepID=A4J1E1_DESRM|nr:sigma 54-interacting transcriptional regulator [Desulforamulus reducens]ABO48894.1 transcriptional regulator [Desulforamulus reducens MI-1]